MADVAKNGQVEEEEDVSIQTQYITHFICCICKIWHHMNVNSIISCSLNVYQSNFA